MHFTGYERDTETGLDHTWFRYYNPRIGRFMTADPYDGSADQNDPQSMHRNAYVENDPANFLDPMGLQCYDANGKSVDISADKCNDAAHERAGYHWKNDPPPTLPRPTVPNPLNTLPGGVRGPDTSGGGANGPTKAHCAEVALKDRGASMALDALGTIPAVGNVASAGRTAITIVKAVTSPAFAVASGAYGANGAISGGSGTADAIVGGTSAYVGIALVGAASVDASKAIPIAGNIISGGMFFWDGYQAIKKYNDCMAGHE